MSCGVLRLKGAVVEVSGPQTVVGKVWVCVIEVLSDFRGGLTHMQAKHRKRSEWTLDRSEEMKGSVPDLEMTEMFKIKPRVRLL